MCNFKDIEWENYHNVLIPQISPLKSIQITKEEGIDLLIKTGAYFLRWTSNFNQQKPTEFWYIIKDKPIIPDELSGNTRSKIKRGLKNCFITKLDAQTVIDQAYPVYINSIKYYHTFLKTATKEQFQKSITILKEKRDFWGIYFRKNNQLIGYCQMSRKDNWVNYEAIKFDRHFLKYYASYALFKEVTNYYLMEQNNIIVSNGTRNLSHDTQIQNFLLEKFLFRKAYCTLNIIYHPKIQKFINIIYPFKWLINRIPITYCQKLSVLLNHEKIRKSFES